MSKKIKFDPNNFNKHTEEGMELLEKSVKEVGVIESIATDKDGAIITGNARKETFDKLGMKPKFIKLEENEYPVIETELEGEKRIRAAILANSVALKNINLDIDAIEDAGIEIEEFKSLGLEDLIKKETQRLSEIEFADVYYEPEEKPEIRLADCLDLTKFEAKKKVIEDSDLPEEIKQTLLMFAYRFIRIDFENVANYYFFNASEDEKRVIERLRMVLCDGGIDGFIEDDLLRIHESLELWVKDV